MPDQLEARWLSQIGGAAAVLGALTGLVGNLIHPFTPGPGDPEGTARVVAESAIWVPVHLALIVGFVLMLLGLVAVQQSITGGLPGALARLGLAAAVVGSTVGVIILTADGFASKHLADAWLAAAGDLRVSALESFRTEEAINFALLSPLNLVFSGFTFILFGLAAALSPAYPRWLGWVVMIGGGLGAASGVTQASMGESSSLSEAIGIAAPTIITLWLIVMGVLLITRAPSVGARPQSPSVPAGPDPGPAANGPVRS